MWYVWHMCVWVSLICIVNGWMLTNLNWCRAANYGRVVTVSYNTSNICKFFAAQTICCNSGVNIVLCTLRWFIYFKSLDARIFARFVFTYLVVFIFAPCTICLDMESSFFIVIKQMLVFLKIYFGWYFNGGCTAVWLHSIFCLSWAFIRIFPMWRAPCGNNVYCI